MTVNNKLSRIVVYCKTLPSKGAPKGGGRLPGCSPLKAPRLKFKKNTDSVDITI